MSESLEESLPLLEPPDLNDAFPLLLELDSVALHADLLWEYFKLFNLNPALHADLHGDSSLVHTQYNTTGVKYLPVYTLCAHFSLD